MTNIDSSHEDITVRLIEPAGAGYSWVVQDTTTLTVEADTREFTGNPPVPPGSPCIRKFKFKLAGAQDYQIDIHLVRRWEKNKPIKVFSLVVKT